MEEISANGGHEDRLYRGSGCSEHACQRITSSLLEDYQESFRDQIPETCSPDCVLLVPLFHQGIVVRFIDTGSRL